MLVVTSSSQKQRSLIVDFHGRKGLRCPRCEKDFDVLNLVVLREIPEYSQDTTPVYKCPTRLGGCGWIFAPADTARRAYLGD